MFAWNPDAFTLAGVRASGGVIRRGLEWNAILSELTDESTQENDVDTTDKSTRVEIQVPSVARRRRGEVGAIGWGVLWLIGVPIPLLLVFFVLRGCT